MVHKTDHEIAIKVPILPFLHFTMYIQFLVQIKGAQMSMRPTISELKAMFTLLYTTGLSLTFWGREGLQPLLHWQKACPTEGFRPNRPL